MTQELLNTLKDMQRIRPTAHRANLIAKEETSSHVWTEEHERSESAIGKAEMLCSKAKGENKKQIRATIEVMRDLLTSEANDFEQRIKSLMPDVWANS